MSYQALYRTHRPQTFEDLIGQESVKRVLLNAVRQDKIAHAYLFTGPRGTGKTTVARLLAKLVNCLNSTVEKPICDACASCQSIKDGSSLDVIEIDAASNRGIDDIRALRERVGYPPQELKRKIYIIDEVHQLSSDAFNALLKTLEEPPSHVIFVLATTEAHKVPATIQSRCQRLIFSHATSVDLAEQLQRVAAKEGATLTAGAVSLLVDLAEGGFRDALSLLERVVALDGTVDESAIAQVFGLGDEQSVTLIVSALADGDRAAVFNRLSELEREGVSPRFLAMAITRRLRRLLYVAVGSLEAQDEEEATLASRLSSEKIWPWLSAWSEAIFETRDVPIPYLPLEIAAARCLTDAPATAPSDAPAPVLKPAESAPTKLVVKPSATTSTDINDSQWGEVVASVTSKNQSIGKLLSQTKLNGLASGRLQVLVAYPFHAEQLGQPTNRSLIAAALSSLGFSDLDVDFISGAPVINESNTTEIASVHDVIDML